MRWGDLLINLTPHFYPLNICRTNVWILRSKYHPNNMFLPQHLNHVLWEYLAAFLSSLSPIWETRVPPYMTHKKRKQAGPSSAQAGNWLQLQWICIWLMSKTYNWPDWLPTAITCTEHGWPKLSTTFHYHKYSICPTIPCHPKLPPVTLIQSLSLFTIPQKIIYKSL